MILAVIFLFHMHYFGLRAFGAQAMLWQGATVRGHCLSSVEVLSECCLGTVSILLRYCLGNLSGLLRNTCGTVLVLSGYCLITVSLLLQYCLGIVSVLSRHRSVQCGHKKSGVWGIFSNLGGGVLPFPKTKQMPLNHPKIIQKTKIHKMI